MKRKAPRRGGFTLIELLVVIAIIGILIGMLLPAVQKVREAASMARCKNHLKQMGIAVHAFHDGRGHMPPGGFNPWGPEGSWPYQILPYIEQDNIFRLAGSGVNINVDPARYQAVSIYICPTRRGVEPKAAQGNRHMMDYASATPANQPNSWDQFWYDDIWGMGWTGGAYKGIIVRGGMQSGTGTWFGARVTMAAISDGTSNTLLIGEKQLHPGRYNNGDWHDDAGWGDGWDPDVVRYTGFQLNPDGRFDNQGGWEGYRFGSAHPTGMNGLMGDGSVRHIPYSINPIIFNALGGRNDGIVINEF